MGSPHCPLEQLHRRRRRGRREWWSAIS